VVCAVLGSQNANLHAKSKAEQEKYDGVSVKNQDLTQLIDDLRNQMPGKWYKPSFVLLPPFSNLDPP
jgi:hypothetical protein